MSDIVSRQKRSEMMSGIKGKNTKPEMLVRKALHRKGFRFRLHRRDLPGKPDIVLGKYRTVVFVNGCFWHGHDCHLFKWPKSNPDFWVKKINDTVARDRSCRDSLEKAGWNVITVWECSLRNLPNDDINDALDALSVEIRKNIDT
ncbi:very short patch repair endonuclease [Pseudohongiella acticola]|jgi:DNA mismatch endonuclease, patch repair protein|uniref:very short patch repair endonuclease n=1 Tax=Pseudohongiella acticola TaxID=1524254 RepID=UPI0030EE7921